MKNLKLINPSEDRWIQLHGWNYDKISSA